MDALHRDWFQIRFCRARYFSTTDLFEKGQKEGDMFNIGRRLLDDENKAIWDRSVPPKAPKAANKWFAKPTTSDEEAPLRGSQGVLSPGNNADENEGQKQSQDQADETIDGKTWLSQIDWEMTHPKEFLSQTRIDFILRKLHTWRRLIPMYREMLLETRSGAFQWLDATEKPQDRQPRVGDDPWDTYKAEFTLILRQMEEFEERIDRLTTVVTSAISIVDSRRVERLSLLATLFVPLSLVSSLFAMSEDIARIKWTYLWWAIASIVLTAVLLVWTWRTRSRQGK
ncbi:hypothetical protein FPOA_13707 [Fusarium poae]|uniref:Uncharacterized protein n=1 Tax=Fusarium poae TaxID=36050 RepID=A0A1B8A4N6_FUSPO|nr:hypothetical protein FPOA_13707 [Fusarium poae]